jgi:hypothetical protein
MEPIFMHEQIEWAYTLENGNLGKPEQDTIFKFMLLFNVFEARLLIGSASQALPKICTDLKNQNWFRIDEYDEYGKFFLERYTDGSDGSIKFEQLKLSKKHNEYDEVKASFDNFKKGNRDDKLFLSYLRVAYRFRNNLFHGSKNALGLNVYVECFEKINWLMHKLLSDMVSNSFDGLDKKYPPPKNVILSR